MNIREWLKEQIDTACAKHAVSKKVEKNEAGEEVIVEKQLKRREFDFNRFLDLSAENGIAADQVEKAREWLDVKNGPGRVRMTLGNQLHTIVSKNGHLKVDGTEVPVPDEAMAPIREAAEAKAAEKQAAKEAAEAKRAEAAAAKEAEKQAKAEAAKAAEAEKAVQAEAAA